jgi:hypothetical protein
MVISIRRKTKGSWGTDMAIGLSRKNSGQGTKVCLVNDPNHRCGLVGHYLSFSFGRGSRVVIGGYSTKAV